LTGWVKNLPAQASLDDGRVEVVTEGEKDKLIRLIELIRTGPTFSRVENVEVTWGKAAQEFEDFTIC
jgi:acylphosphatase